MPLPHRRAALLAAAALLTGATTGPAADADPDSYWVFLGTYTGKDGSKGIYRSRLDAKTGKLAAAELAAEVTSPSFLALHPGGKFLYAVGEAGGVPGGKGGGVFAFAVDPATGQLDRLNQQDSLGAGPCHVSVDPAGKTLAVANYGGGSSAVYPLGPDGRIGAPAAFHQYKGSSVNPQRQKEPHSHCTAFDKSGKHLFVVDLGLDAVMVHPVNGAGGAGWRIDLPKGSGPRHIALNDANTVAYVNGELDMTVNVVSLDLSAGKFEVVQTVSTLPDGKPQKGHSTAEVRVHPSGKFVYVSNRGHNSVAAFRVGDGGKLTPIGHATEGIKTPRNFNIDPTGRWMLVANQDGGDVKVFEIDAASGLPKPTGNAVAVSRCVCVKFLPVGK